MFKKSEIETYLGELDCLSQEANIILEIDIYGGCAFLLAYESRFSTHDVDAIIKPAKEGWRLVGKVAEKHGLPDDWMNSDVFQFLSPLAPRKEALRKLDTKYDNLRVSTPNASYLLAMKAIACRPGHSSDEVDLKFLIQKMGIRSTDEIQEHIDRFYPDCILEPRNRVRIAGLIEEGADREK